MIFDLCKQIALLINSRPWTEHPEPFVARSVFEPRTEKADLKQLDVTIMPEAEETNEHDNRDYVPNNPTISICIRHQVGKTDNDEAAVEQRLRLAIAIKQHLTNNDETQLITVEKKEYRRIKTIHDPLVDWKFLAVHGIFSSWISLEYREL